MAFTAGQRRFIDSLARHTGLDRRVIGAWVLSEESGSAARSREAQRNNNWLNIGYFDSGPGGMTRDRVWRSPERAARATAQFLRGERYNASPGIRKILHSRGSSAGDQIAAIASSGWASSGYNGGANLRSVYGNLGWMRDQAPAGARARGMATRASGATRQPQARPDDQARRQAVAQWLLSSSNDPVQLAQTVSEIPDVQPAQRAATRREPSRRAGHQPTVGRVSGTHLGSPVPGQQRQAATHPTAGLPGYPAYDYMAPAGSSAVAPVSGTVVKLSGHDPGGGPPNGPHGPFGWSVYIKGDDGHTYFLTHMGARSVHVGQRVRRGQRIGNVGNYARWGGANHIHMGVN